MITHKLFPDAVLVVPESEKENYSGYKLQIKTVPDEIVGLSKLRNWVLDNFCEEIILMVDDDVKCLSYVAGYLTRRIIEPEVVWQIVENTGLCAKDIGTSCFGFNQNWDSRKYQHNKPFKLSGWCGGAIGVVGRKIRFFERNMLKVDIDYCLETMLKDRILWIDNRYAFYQIRNINVGGNSTFRTKEKVRQEIANLKEKWGKFFVHKYTRTGEEVQIKVDRTQTINA
jgi:hypothetical protein